MKLIVNDIAKTYDRPVLNHITYTFYSGKIYVIKGVSGCGKTTFLNILAGLETSYSGNVEYDSMPSRPQIGYIFQNSLLIAQLTIRENLNLISSDNALILQLANEVGIGELLDKFPSQLSGGERQRVAIVRSLLRHPHIILADEPTASLDRANSEQIARLINGLRSPNRIIIVATHESCFDQYADKVIHMQYGEIDKETSLHVQDQTENNFNASTAFRPSKIAPVTYAIKKNPKIIKIQNIFPLTMAFILVLLLFAVQTNFPSEYTLYLQNKYPLDLIVFNESELNNFPDMENLCIYDNYVCSENNIYAYYLLDCEDSVLGIDGMIVEGVFPDSPDEILVTQDFIDYYFDGVEKRSYINENVEFANHNFRISGILNDLSMPVIEHNLFADAYYQRNIQKNSIFIPYDTIKNFGTLTHSNFVIAVYPNLPESERILAYLSENTINGVANQFYMDIKTEAGTINNITKILSIILFISYGTACIFFVTIVYSDLFVRKRELGYLQIFGIKKSRIFRLVFAEYQIKASVSVVAAAIIYFILLLCYCIVRKHFLTFIDFSVIASIIGMIIIYLSSALLAICFYLKRSILSLIT